MNHQSKLSKNAAHILPEDPDKAARELIKISGSLLRIADRETQALVQNDLVTFTILQDEKELLAARYQKASEEFRGRVEEFRAIEKGQINQLEAIQRQLNDALNGNNRIVNQMYGRAQKKTHDTLLKAQEMGQNVPINFPEGQSGAANNQERAS